MDQQKNNISDDRVLLEDLVLEILTRLPVKSLLRFRSVCKRWRSLISAYSFRKLHRERHISSLPLILTCHDSSYGAEDYDPDSFNFYLTAFDLYGRVIQQYTLPISSDKLLLLPIPSQSKLLGFVEASEYYKLFSYNPSTRQLFRLPDPACFSLPDFKYCIPSLGYIPFKDEYILVIFVGKKPWVCEVLTFSISDDNFELHYSEWRYIEVPTMVSSNVAQIFSNVFVCSVFYWAVHDENGNACIISFDVETEVFSTLRFPQGVPICNLLELKEELYLMSLSQNSLILNLWKLGSDDNKSWTLYKTFNLKNLGFRDDFNDGTEFDWQIFIYRLEYLKCYNEPSNVLLEMGMLKLEEDVDELEEDDVVLEEDDVDVLEEDDVVLEDVDVLEEDDDLGEVEEDEYIIPEYIMPDWAVNIHTNLFTL